ncbi:hypothetical protein [Bacillus sp. H1F1]|uniref:hypothetical protein n=1 Tax=Bacillus sp. H1F1 TaxID=2994530 RepID=UPI00224ADB0F|nr:hypothetical protein [Bacillus sp. H1F1]MCX2823321.1 hypothetical protein [Bacillus sp. H1F1]
MNDTLEELNEDLRNARTSLLFINGRLSELDYYVNRRMEVLDEIKELECLIKKHGDT